MTESAFFSSLSEKGCYDNLGVEQYEILATLDSRTSEICQNLDGKVFDMNDFQPGVTAPPFHVNCRSTTVPHFDDNFGNIDERAARDKDGKTYYVPADMTYKDWKKSFVDGGDKLHLKPIDNSGESGIIKAGSDSMALENQRYGRNKDTLVNKTYIESGEYRRKFDNATDNSKVNKTLYDCAKKALKHRSGTVLEDMYWIDGNTGEIVTKETDSLLKRKIEYSTSTKKIVNSYEKNKLIAIHTHPSSMPPSAGDFNSCYHNGYKCGYIACHDGKIFAYTSEQSISDRLYNIYIGQFIDDGHDEFTAQLKALSELKKNHNIDFWEVK